MALEGAFSVIVKTGCETDGALDSTSVKLQENKIVRIYEATGADLAGTPPTPTNTRLQHSGTVLKLVRVK